MAGKLSGNAIVSGSVTSTQLSSSVNNSIAQGGGPKITQIQITDSSYNVLDDTAVSTSGGYIKITGTGFNAGAVVIIGTVNATSTAYVSSTTLNVQVPAAVAGTYVVYVVNTDGGTAIAVNGLTYSALPNWVTGSTLPSGTSNTPISIQLNATDATSYALAAGNTLPSGLTLTSGGLLSGTVTVGVETVYSFTVVATDAQAQDSPRAFTITIIVGDPYFYLTTLLLPGNGTNNGTNNTFLDSSTNNYTITRAGNSTQGTFSPFSLTGWSNYFDGNGDSLTFTATSAVSLTGAFTIEFWIYLNSTALDSINPSIITFPTQPNAYQIYINSANTYFALYNGTADVVKTANGSATLNQWIHIAVSRDSSNNLSIFLNGSRSATTASGSGTVGTSTGTFRLMSYDGSTGDVQGYLSNLRIVKGTAVYDPTQTTLTVPTSPLTAIANTSLLTCQNNRFIDNSTNNFTISKGGDVSVQSFSPFAPAVNYSTSTVGGSVYLDGTGDYLSTVTTPANFGSNNFTIETWVWFNTNSVGYQPLLHCTGGGDYQGWGMITETSNILWFLCSTNGSSWTNSINTNIIPTTNCWTHLAVVRNSSTITYYVNGVSAGTTNIGASSIQAPSNAFYTGYYPYFPGGARAFNGYFSGTRLVNGTAVYTSNFTPPTAPPSPVANTSLLQNYTNGQIIDATSKNDLETVADAKISTAQSKWGGSSMYFDGTGDSLISINSPLQYFGTGSWTIEFWVKSSMSTRCDIINYNYSYSIGTWAGLLLNVSASGQMSWYETSNLRINATSTGWNDNNWHHIAISRNGNSVRMFLDGIQVGSTYTSSYTYGNTSSGWRVGSSTEGFNLNGYMQDIRITNGYARYTTNFTPPTSAFPTL